MEIQKLRKRTKIISLIIGFILTVWGIVHLFRLFVG